MRFIGKPKKHINKQKKTNQIELLFFKFYLNINFYFKMSNNKSLKKEKHIDLNILEN